jgi:hypothetical protein
VRQANPFHANSEMQDEAYATKLVYIRCREIASSVNQYSDRTANRHRWARRVSSGVRANSG